MDCSITSLAYIGDAVFELYIREKNIKDFPFYDQKKLTKLTICSVNAKSQATRLEKILKYLNEEELDCVRKAKNAKYKATPKNTDIKAYRLASALEALIGMLYMSKKQERLQELLKLSEIED